MNRLRFTLSRHEYTRATSVAATNQGPLRLRSLSAKPIKLPNLFKHRRSMPPCEY